MLLYKLTIMSVKYVLSVLFAFCVSSCISTFNEAPKHVYNSGGQSIEMDTRYGYILKSSNKKKIPLYSGPGQGNTVIAKLENGRFVGIAGPQAGNWAPLKILEAKGVIIGYATVGTLFQLERTKHKFAEGD